MPTNALLQESSPCSVCSKQSFHPFPFPAQNFCILSEILKFLLRSSSGSLIFGPSSSDKWH